MIPRTAHFVCLGQDLSWAHALSIHSALARGGFDRALLHHSQDLARSAGYAALDGLVGFEAIRLEALVADEAPEARALRQVLTELDRTSAREDVVRAALLWQHGGVFLSLDTVAVSSFDDVFARNEFFCGESATTRPSSNSKRSFVAAAVRKRLGRALERAPRAASRAAEFWPKVASPAVMGAPAQDPFVGRLLAAMAHAHVEERRKPGALGSDILESVLNKSRTGTVLYPSTVFDPCGGPRASWWFHDPSPTTLSALKSRETLTLRWHQEIAPRQIVAIIDAEALSKLKIGHLFSALAADLKAAQTP
ncbi:MAG: hypothetical protein ACJAYU_000021 [Bradymonadia bacterium]|jgi:hypothetical protein